MTNVSKKQPINILKPVDNGSLSCVQHYFCNFSCFLVIFRVFLKLPENRFSVVTL